MSSIQFVFLLVREFISNNVVGYAALVWCRNFQKQYFSRGNFVYFIGSNSYGGFVNLFMVPYSILTHRSGASYYLIGGGWMSSFNLALTYKGIDISTLPFT